MGKSSTGKVWLAFLLSLPWDSGVGADKFAFCGLEENPLYSVPGSNWTFNTTSDGLHFNYPPFGSSGRFLYPDAVQMIDPGSTAVKSFSSLFIYRIDRTMGTGPGMAFCKAPDNVTLGAPGDIMGIISSETGKKYESDNHTLGVELDTCMIIDLHNNSLVNASLSTNFLDVDYYSQRSNDYNVQVSKLSSIPNYEEVEIHHLRASKIKISLDFFLEESFTGNSSASKILSHSNLTIVGERRFSNERKKKSLCILLLVFVLFIVSVGTIICIIVSLSWCRFVASCPLRIFISHTGGPNGSHKNFPTWLDERMRTWPWSVAKSRVRIFFDRKDVEMGKSIEKKIFKELARFDVGVVVVTNAFFVAKWPMTELIAFVEAQTNDPTDRIRVLPLFYELLPEQVKAHLIGKTWDGHWEDMSKGNHPLQVGKCREAVTWLCQQRGIPYDYVKRHHDEDYIKKICKEVNEILCKERSFASYLIRTVNSYRVLSLVKREKQPSKLR